MRAFVNLLWSLAGFEVGSYLCSIGLHHFVAGVRRGTNPNPIHAHEFLWGARARDMDFVAIISYLNRFFRVGYDTLLIGTNPLDL